MYREMTASGVIKLGYFAVQDQVRLYAIQIKSQCNIRESGDKVRPEVERAVKLRLRR